MNETEEPRSSTTEIVLVSGDRYRVEGDRQEVEAAILDAARGSIMQLAWFAEAETDADIAVNPEYVAALRSVSSHTSS